MRKIVSSWGILFVLAAVCLVTGIFMAVSRSGFQSVYLLDLEEQDYHWEYEIRTLRGDVREVRPQYVDEYNYVLSDEPYSAVRERRTMTEYLQSAEIHMGYMGCGIEVFLDGRLLYSDFQTTERDAAGYLLVDDAEITDEPKSVTVNLPDDYLGSELTLITYFPENAQRRNPVVPHLLSENTIMAAAVADVIKPILWLAFLGVMTLVLSVFCMISVLHHHAVPKLFLLLLVYSVSFTAYACRSAMGFYSGLQERLNGMLPVDTVTVEMLLLTVSAILILILEIREGRENRRNVPLVQVVSFGLIGLLFTAIQESSELANGVTSYFPTIALSVACGNFVPLVRLISSVIIYTLTLLTLFQFARWVLSEWRKNTILLERSKFARENYELVMQVDESSRRRNHELKHHMQTLYSLLAAQKSDEAKTYIEDVINEAAQYAEMTYSENIVLNSIVGIRLNQARKNGIDVQCHIHVPRTLEADNVDLSILLSNMLENAMEACMRMESREGAYIHLEIRKKQRFLFIECENSANKQSVPEEAETTTKDDRKNHGFGLDAMRAVAEKYASIIQIERRPGSFTVRTNLCLPE